MDNPDNLNYPLTKAAGALVLAGGVNVIELTHWFQLGAAVLAFLYGLAVLIEWVWKRARRPKKPDA